MMAAGMVRGTTVFIGGGLTTGATAAATIFIGGGAAPDDSLDAFFYEVDELAERARFRALYRAIPASQQLRAGARRIEVRARRLAPPRTAPWPAALRAYS